MPNPRRVTCYPGNQDIIKFKNIYIFGEENALTQTF